MRKIQQCQICSDNWVSNQENKRFEIGWSCKKQTKNAPNNRQQKQQKMQQIKVKQTNSRKDRDALWRAASQLTRKINQLTVPVFTITLESEENNQYKWGKEVVDSHYTFKPLNKGSTNLTCLQFIHLYIHTTE